MGEIPDGLTVQGYRNEIPEPHIMHVKGRQRFFLPHDNGSPHTARLTMDCLEQNIFKSLPWSSKSPDFNHKEHLWGQLVKRVHRH